MFCWTDDMLDNVARATATYHEGVTAEPCRPDDCRDLDDDFGWALGAVFRAYAKASRSAMDDVPGGPRGWQVLAAAAGDQPGTQLAIARRLGIDRTVMTYLLDDLERADLVQRTPDPNDRRARRLTVTAAGFRLLEDLTSRLTAVEHELLDCLEEPQREALRDSLRRIALHLDADPGADRCEAAAELDR
jgi:DNA-binding MarR family transcriptional regulator